MRHSNRIVAVVLASVLCASPALAEETTPGDHLDGAIKRITGALNYVLKAVPQYEAPEVLENGDIIIRRVQPKPDEEEKENDAADAQPKDGVRL